MRNSLHFGTGNDECETPQDLYDELDAEFHFTRDVCATPENAKHKHFWTKEDNCLTKVWSGVCWMNPPYSKRERACKKKCKKKRCEKRGFHLTEDKPGLYQFVEKAAIEAILGRATTVCLLAARTDVHWWHDYVWNSWKHGPITGVEIRFICGRLRFSGAEDSAPFPSVVIIFHRSKS